MIGDGSLTARMWTKPAISVLGIDAPRVAEASNQLVPVARAKVSMRIPPGQDATTVYLVTRFRNTSGGYIEGIELNAQQPFTYGSPPGREDFYFAAGK